MTSKIVKVFFAPMMAALTFCYGEQQLTIANFSFLLKKVRVLVCFFRLWLYPFNYHYRCLRNNAFSCVSLFRES